MTFLAALRHDRIDAPAVFDGPINAVSFTAYVEQFLIPTLKPGDICAFRGMAATDSDLSRPPIPIHRGHRFRRIAASLLRG